MERCIYEAYANVKPVPNGEWIAEAHMNGTVCTVRTSSHRAAVQWANARVRAQTRYWEEVRRDANPPLRIHTRSSRVDDVPACLRTVLETPQRGGYAAVILHGYDGCLAMFAYAHVFYEPQSAALTRAVEWLRHGK